MKGVEPPPPPKYYKEIKKPSVYRVKYCEEILTYTAKDKGPTLVVSELNQFNT